MKKIIMSLLIALFVFPVTIFAADCSNDEIVKLKTAINKIDAKLVPSVMKDVIEDPDTGEIRIVDRNVFRLIFSNLTDDFDYKLYDGTEILWDSNLNLELGDTYNYRLYDTYEKIRQYDFVITSKNCDRSVFTTKKIIIPMYNPFHNYNVCDNNKDFYLCQEYWYQDYSNNQVLKEIKQYENNEIDKNGKKKEKSFLEKINDFVKKNYSILIIILGVIIGFGVVMFVRRQIRMKKHFG